MEIKKDYRGFVKILTALGEIYSRELSKSVIDLYWAVLAPKMTLDAFQQKAQKILENRVYTSFPKPADFLTSDLAEEKEAEEEAQVKWIEVRDASYYESHDFGRTANSVIERVFGGWMNFKDKLAVELEAVMKKEFITYYKIFKLRGEGAVDFVVGFFEQENESRGFIEHKKYGYPPGKEVHAEQEKKALLYAKSQIIPLEVEGKRVK